MASPSLPKMHSPAKSQRNLFSVTPRKAALYRGGCGIGKGVTALLVAYLMSPRSPEQGGAPPHGPIIFFATPETARVILLDGVRYFGGMLRFFFYVGTEKGEQGEAVWDYIQSKRQFGDEIRKCDSLKDDVETARKVLTVTYPAGSKRFFEKTAVPPGGGGQADGKRTEAESRPTGNENCRSHYAKMG